MSQVEIGNLIEENLQQLVKTWTDAVRQDPRIQSDTSLSLPELIDHVPAIIEEICELIRKSETPGVRNSDEGRANAYIRFHQGYKGRDLVRELSLLRITLLDYLMETSTDDFHDLDAREVHSASTIINLYLDEELRYVVSLYSQPPGSTVQEPLETNG